MMSKVLLRTIPVMQSLALAGHSYKTMIKPKKKNKVKGMIKGTAGILVGIPLIEATALQVEGF